MAQATPRDFNMSARLKETSMLLMGIESWDATMKLPDAERLAAFGDPRAAGGDVMSPPAAHSTLY